ncbi:hypothetical protein yc1106_01656 [Curvularia clavata]|uniref:Pre-mRNA splicing factor CLF1 n=1 Tax=Curvularia clavata TaxID=95742 RepID=A0A9Q8Z1I1_CURCL|nr:hypothetical protein yc1106_01656 [Curvularia clavata]
MALPKPIYPLKEHCSVIYEGTLYVYSPAGFQSLKLEEGAKWQALPMDVSLTGGVCVKAVPKGNTQDAKLFIVGGRVNETASNWNYPGLMHYTFSKKKWDWQRSESWNTQNRVNHGAAYLQDSQNILVYSGSQSDGASPSSETFLMSTVAPYAVSGLPSAGAPPSVKPMLMDVNSNTAFLVGGGASNTAVWKFTEAEGWRNLNVALQQPITNQDAVQCSIISNKDGGIALQKFDMSATPNTVERILLLNKDGSPAAPGTRVGGKAGGKSKRATLNSWSPYNETFAPTVPRSGYSLAQGTDGTTVATGGNDQEPIALFDDQKNSWMNATAVFSGQQVLVNSVSSSTISATATSSVSAPATSSPTSTGVAASPVGPPSNKGRMLTVLGATLGTIFGIAVLLILILVCLKYRKNKSKSNAQAEKNDRMSFADRGAAFMKEAGGSVASYQPKYNESTTSLAIIQGRGTGHKKNMASDASTAGLVKKTSPLGYSEQYSEPYELAKFDLKPEPVEPIVRQNSSRVPKTEPRARSSGWSRYFANNEATNLASAPPADRSTFASDRTSTISQSQYTNSHHMYSSRPSQHIAPLEIPKFSDGQRLSSVASGSPTLGTPNSFLPHQVQPMQAELARANSNASSVSAFSHDGDHHTRQPVDSWTPVGNDRRTSSQYTGSMAIDHGKFDGTSSYYPDGTDSFYPKSNFSSFYPGQGATPVIPDLRDSTVTMFPSGGAPPVPTDQMPPSKFSSMYPTPPRLGDFSHERESVATLFPGGSGPAQGQNDAALPSPKFNSFYAPPRVGHDSTVTMFPGPAPHLNDGKKEQSDMSWLNLGQSR